LTVHRHAVAGLFAVALAALTGCEGSGVFNMIGHDMRIESAEVGSDAAMSGRFNTVYYSYDDPDTLDVVMIAGPEDQPDQAVHIQMYWRPQAGLTPLDESATNAVVRYTIFGDGQAALYGGGGMLRPGSKPGEERSRASLANASLRLMDGEATAEGPVGDNAVAAGAFTATRDDLRTAELVRSIERRLKDQLGYPRFIGEGERVDPLASR